MMRAFRFLTVLIALLCLASCGKGVSGGEPTAHAEAPLFSPLEGAYEGALIVSLLCGTEGASIHYTTDGSTPTTASPVYAAGITVNSSKTLKAISVKNGMADSAVASATYTITAPISTRAGTPSFSPEGGTYNSAQEVTISSATPESVIYYTTNGSAPSSSGIQYSGPIAVSEDVTIKAIAVKSGMTDSDVASAAYNIDITLPMAEAPVFSPPPGLYGDSQFVTIETATPEARILYTTNGTTPNSSSEVYSGPLEVLFNTTVKAIAVKDGYADSSVKSATYTIDNPPPVVENPVFTPNGGSFADAQTVAITTATPGATIHYTLNGTTPTSASPVYNAPLDIRTGATVKAYAVKFGWTDSGHVEAEFAISASPEPGELWTDPVTGMVFAWVPPGTFTMGDEFGGGSYDEKPAHSVTLTKGFWMGIYEVTQDQWKAIKGTNPSHYIWYVDSPSRPVEMVNGSDIASYIAEANVRTGQTYRLPTEAEWEYAAKGAKSPGTRYAGTSNESLIGDYAWYEQNTIHGFDNFTEAVGRKLPNELGLYDMSGNVFEFVKDWYSSGYYSISPSTDPKGPETGYYQVIRGGSCFSESSGLRTSNRYSVDPDSVRSRYIDVGFRLAR